MTAQSETDFYAELDELSSDTDDIANQVQAIYDQASEMLGENAVSRTDLEEAGAMTSEIAEYLDQRRDHLKRVMDALLVAVNKLNEVPF